MPTGLRAEDIFIRLFLSAYENGSWANAQLQFPDKEIDGGVDGFATRTSDSKTLAIEHTIIEPFVGDKGDFAFFEQNLLHLENEPALLAPRRWILVFVPIGPLKHLRREAEQAAMIESVRNWIKFNRFTLPDGPSQHVCAINGLSEAHSLEVILQSDVIPLQDSPSGRRGELRVRRQQIDSNLDQVVATALKNKLPKLRKTPADKRILLLECQHDELAEPVLAEIETQKPLFPGLSEVDEIWIVKTKWYNPRLGHDYLCFELFDNGIRVNALHFKDGVLILED